eukprot:m.306043 g.306043  ORF g.306043 m.306043 type:complete len:92 (+) comp23019_c1_seq7:708-983(+)
MNSLLLLAVLLLAAVARCRAQEGSCPPLLDQFPNSTTVLVFGDQSKVGLAPSTSATANFGFLPAGCFARFRNLTTLVSPRELRVTPDHAEW